MGWLGDVFSFEAFNLEEMLRKARKNPDQLLLGAADPFSASMWGKITGKEYTPIINQMGGASADTYEKAEARGINTGPGRQAHTVAELIASIYAGGAAAGAMGGGASAGASATNSVGPLASGYAYPASTSAAGAVGPLASGYAYPNMGAYGYTGAGSTPVLANGAALNGSSSGLTFDQVMQLMQNMPQGQKQEEQQLPPPPNRSIPSGNGRFPTLYEGEVDLANKRRRRKRRGLLED